MVDSPNASCSETEDGSFLSSEGTVVRKLTIPLSNLVSSDFKKFYLNQMAIMASLNLEVPRLGAPKAQWDEFDRAQSRLNIEVLERVKELYQVRVAETSVAGVPAAIITPEGGVPVRNRSRILVNLYGGGFIVNRGLNFGQLESIPVSALGGFKVITLDYRQAPFHSYPAASEDVEAVYRELARAPSRSRVSRR